MASIFHRENKKAANSNAPRAGKISRVKLISIPLVTIIKAGMITNHRHTMLHKPEANLGWVSGRVFTL